MKRSVSAGPLLKRHHAPSPVLPCPICAVDIAPLLEEDRNVHVNGCLGVVPEDKVIVVKEEPVVALPPRQPRRPDLLWEYTYGDVGRKPEKVVLGPVISAASGGTQHAMLRRKRPVPRHKLLTFPAEYTPVGLPDLVASLFLQLPLPRSTTLAVAVDAFSYAPDAGVAHYFLTHFHADHFGGLCNSWCNGVLYGSEITIKLAQRRFPSLDPLLCRVLPMETPTPVILNGNEFTVTLIDANHCPGAVLFLFELAGKVPTRVLHCGDFRVARSMLTHPALQQPMDRCYLDTTYCHPRYTFPPQPFVIATACQFMAKCMNGDYAKQLDSQPVLKPSPERPFPFMVLIGTYTIGKERIAFEIAATLNCKLYANDVKRETLAVLGERYTKQLTDDPYSTPIHLVQLGQTRDLDAYLTPFKDRFRRVLMVELTGWLYVPRASRKGTKLAKRQRVGQMLVEQDPKGAYGIHELEAQLLRRYAKGQYVIPIQVPYSEHSSFRELAFFVVMLPLGMVLPTVGFEGEPERQQLWEWIDAWQYQRRRMLAGKLATEGVFGGVNRAVTVADFD